MIMAMPSALAATPSGLSRYASSCEHDIPIAGNLRPATAIIASFEAAYTDSVLAEEACREIIRDIRESHRA